MIQHDRNTVGAQEAKTNLGDLLDRVERGETIVITRHGDPVARLVPFGETIDREAVARAGLRELQHKHTLGQGLTVEALIAEGREL